MVIPPLTPLRDDCIGPTELAHMVPWDEQEAMILVTMEKGTGDTRLWVSSKSHEKTAYLLLQLQRYMVGGQ